MTEHVCGLTAEQYNTLRKPLNGTRVAKRSQGGKELSYLESWDVRAHLTRIFGFLGFDLTTEDQYLVTVRPYQSNNNKDMVECVWFVKMRLVVKCSCGNPLAEFSESAVGSTSGPANMIGEHHDNAVKTAASDALKRCAINLGTQFGLSLYDNGSYRDVIKGTLVTPEGVEKEEKMTPEQAAALESSVGVRADKPEQVEEAVKTAQERLGAERLPEEDPSTTEAMQTNGTAADIAAAQQGGIPGVTSEPGPDTTGVDRFDPETVERHADDDEPFKYRTNFGKAMFAMINESDWEEADRIANISAVIERDITSTKEMTQREARIVMARLDWEKEHAA